MQTNKFRRAVLLVFFLPFAVAAQESVDVPQILQNDVRAFKLTMDSLSALTENVHDQTRRAMNALKIVEQKMALKKDDFRAFHLEKRQFEQIYADYLDGKYQTLKEMEGLRLQTLDKLENMLTRFPKQEDFGATVMQNKISEQIRRTEDLVAQTRIEMLQILEKLQQEAIEPDERAAMQRKLQILQQNGLALHEESLRRLRLLHQQAGTQNKELPAVRRSLAEMRDHLQNGFGWINAEMIYIDLYAEQRQNWLAVEARLLEMTGVAEQFSRAVEKINESGEALQEMRELESRLYENAPVPPELPGIPALKWPGQPRAEADGKTPWTQTRLDSMRQALKKALAARKPQTP